MSEARSALPGAVFSGTVSIREAGLQGMITLRGDLGAAAMAAAVRAATGARVPGRREIVHAGAAAAAWMSPDELLLLVDHQALPEALAAIEAAFAAAGGEGHFLAVDVSDARAMFVLEGPDAALREVIAKLCPVDMAPAAFGPGEIRRTRMGQLPAALWMPDAGSARVICFRSVAEYAFALLSDAALPGGEVGLFA